MQIYKTQGISEARPFPHHTIKRKWLLPVIISDGEITLFLGHNYSKTLVIKNNKGLPKIDTKEGNWDLLTQLTILKANDEDRCPPDEFIQNEIYLFIPPWGEERNEVGWRVSESWWVLIVNEEVLNNLRGKPIRDSEFDVLKESDDLFKRLQKKRK